MPKISQMAADSTGVDPASLIPIVVGGANKKAVARDLQKLPIVTVATATLTLTAAHRFCYLRFTHASGCVVTLNNNVFAEGDWLILCATQAAAVSFAGSLTPSVPPSKAATSAEANATMSLVFSSATAAQLDGRLSDS